MAKLEEEIDMPEKSAVFRNTQRSWRDYPHHALHFICDTLRTAVAGVVPAHDLDDMLEKDIEIHHHQKTMPIRALATCYATRCPVSGIGKAAVLGVSQC